MFEPKPSSHEEFGGIHPSVAIEAHQRNMVESVLSIQFNSIDLSLQPGAVRMALEQANMSIHDIDGIAFTRGPGTRAFPLILSENLFSNYDT